VRTTALVTPAVALAGAASAAVPSPPAGKLYHGVYPGGMTGEEDDIAPAVVWENDDKPAHDTDMRVQDNPRLADACRTLVGAKANVLGRVGQ
jgi:hypothetical protein